MFTNNKKYEVKSIILGSVSGLPFISLFIYDDFGVRRFLDSDLKSESLSKILFSVKQIRKQKLDKIKKL